MIPLNLKFSGLYSYKEEQTIDFEQLTQAQLFGIFGPVGSGKSSVLEAITLALFNKTDRINQGVNYNTMNLSSERLFIDFKFKNYEGRVFRSIIENKRNSKDFEKVLKKQHALYELIDGVSIPCERDIKDVLKMSYENFKKTVIIPQGRFLEFLNLTPSKRSDMLQELFKLDRFDLAANASKLKKLAEMKISELEGKLSTFEFVSEEMLSSQRLKHGQNKSEILSQEAALIELRKEEKLLSSQKQNHHELILLKKKWDGLSEQSAEIQSRKARLRDYQYCKENFELLINEKLSLGSQIKKNENLAKTLDEAIVALQLKYEKTKFDFATAKHDYAEVPKKQQEIDDLKEWIQIKGLQEKLVEVDSNLQKGEDLISKSKAVQSDIHESINRLNEEIKILNEEIPDFSVLSEIINWHGINDNLKERLIEIKQRDSQIANRRKSLNGDLLEDFNLNFHIEASEVLDLDFKLKSKVLQCQDELKSLESEIAGLSIHAKLEEFAEAMQKGEPCPLCGSEHHPELFSMDGIKKKFDELNRKKKEQENQALLYNKAKEQLTKFLAIYEAEKEEQENSRKISLDLEEKLVSHQSAFVWEKYRELSLMLLKKRQSEGVEKMKRKKELSQRLESTQKDLELKVSEISRFNERLRQRQNEKIKYQTELETRIEQLKLIFDEPQGSADSLIVKLDQLQNDIQLSLRKFEVLTQRVQLEEENLKKHSQELAHVNHHLEHDNESFKIVESKLEETLATSSFKTEKEVLEILESKIDRDKEQREIRQFEDQILVTQNRITSLEESFIDRSYDSVKHEHLINDISIKELAIKNLEKETAKLELTIQEMQKNLETQRQITKERDSMNLRFQNLGELLSLFKGSKFVNFISRIHLKEVCHIANKRFIKLTRKTLELTLSDNNDFLVLDYLNGAKVRQVKSLSGGQQFQAALSLALALAESVQNQLGTRQNFFFIDEGFGTLDKESMQDAVKTLSDLRKEGRIVGIISHIEALQDEVDIFLGVKNDTERGSFITRSWVS